MTYKFNEVKHIHTLDDKPLCGVTTVLSVISKPALIQWSANMACDHIQNNWLKCWEELGEEPTFNSFKFEDLIKEARTAHRIKKEKAGDWGTVVHKKIELWIKDKKEYSTSYVIDLIVAEGNKNPELKEEERKVVDEVFKKFLDWAEENKVEFLESEKHLYSKDLWIGGIMDLVLTIDGKKYIGDIKTSSGIYNEAFFQCAAYHLCLEEMKEADGIEGYIVINLKKDGKIDFKIATDLELNQNAFKHALGLYKIINSLE